MFLASVRALFIDPHLAYEAGCPKPLARVRPVTRQRSATLGYGFDSGQWHSVPSPSSETMARVHAVTINAVVLQLLFTVLMVDSDIDPPPPSLSLLLSFSIIHYAHVFVSEWPYIDQSSPTTTTAASWRAVSAEDPLIPWTSLCPERSSGEEHTGRQEQHTSYRRHGAWTSEE